MVSLLPGFFRCLLGGSLHFAIEAGGEFRSLLPEALQFLLLLAESRFALRPTLSECVLPLLVLLLLQPDLFLVLVLGALALQILLVLVLVDLALPLLLERVFLFLTLALRLLDGFFPHRLLRRHLRLELRLLLRVLLYQQVQCGGRHIDLVQALQLRALQFNGRPQRCEPVHLIHQLLGDSG